MTALREGRGRGGDAKGRSLRKAASNKGFVWSSRGGGVGVVRAKGLWDSGGGDKKEILHSAESSGASEKPLCTTSLGPQPQKRIPHRRSPTTGDRIRDDRLGKRNRKSKSVLLQRRKDMAPGWGAGVLCPYAKTRKKQIPHPGRQRQAARSSG